MATIRHQIAIQIPVAALYEKLSDPDSIGTWWDQQTAVPTESGLVLEHNPGPQHGVVRLKVVQQVQNRRVEWECISRHPDASPASAWTGTHFIFEISDEDSPASIAEREASQGNASRQLDGPITTLNFSQTGYPEGSKFFGFNNFAWGQVLSNLKNVCEATGAA